MKARDVRVGDLIRTWAGWVTVTNVCPEPEFDDEEDGVSFSVKEAVTTYHLGLSDEVDVVRSAS